MKEFTTPEPLARVKLEDHEVVLDLLWFCAHYLDRAKAFRYDTAGAAGLRAAGRIEQALLDGQEPGSKVRLHDVDFDALRDTIESGECGAPETGLVNTQTGEPVTVPDRALLRFINAIAEAADVAEEKAQAAE